MIYIVSGYRRSGTSMMMKALSDGLESGQVLFQPAQERIGAKEESGYIPNPSGLMEVGQLFYMNAEFLRRIPDKSLLKILYDGLPNLPAGDYTIIFMRRNPEDILASCDRVDRHLRQVGVRENPDRSYTFDCFRPYRQEEIDHVVGIMKQRKDVQLIEVDFDSVVDDPLTTFKRIKYSPLGKDRVPINIEQAAAAVNPKFRRFHREDGDANDESRNGGSRTYREDRKSA